MMNWSENSLRQCFLIDEDLICYLYIYCRDLEGMFQRHKLLSIEASSQDDFSHR
ncbi:hypothetical protein Sjap_018313 [Stephania japonica]|uniref:Uncharacterized protein n=1 Tax=Stephania japonica TaxID=461633 RepID=A0AAP0I7Z1_9MAGN